MKYFFLIFMLTGCSISGNYSYTNGDRDRHKNDLVLGYSKSFKKFDYKIFNKINSDPIHLDKPGYYETSHEIWFW